MWTKTTTRPNSHTAKDKPTGSPHTAPPNKPNEHDPKGRARLAYVDDGGGGGIIPHTAFCVSMNKTYKDHSFYVEGNCKYLPIIFLPFLLLALSNFPKLRI